MGNDGRFPAPPVYDGHSPMEYGVPGTAAWVRKAYKHIQALEEAVQAACVLIWVEDAMWAKGGAAALDAWVDEYKTLVGFSTGNDEGVVGDGD